MAVVVDHGNAARRSANLKAAIDSAKTGDTIRNLFRRQPKLMRDGDGGRGIKCVVATGTCSSNEPSLAVGA